MSPTVPAPGPRRFWRKRYLVLLVIGALALWYGFNASRGNRVLERLRAAGYPTTPAELDRWYATVPPAENLSGPILRAAGVVRLPSGNTNAAVPYIGANSTKPAPATPVAPEMLAQWQAVIASNTEVWAHLAESRNRTRSRAPINLNQGFNTLLPHLSQIKQLALACAIRAVVAAEEGKSAESMEALQDLLRVRHSILEEPLLISGLVGFAADSIGFRATQDCIARVRFTDAQLLAFSTQIRTIASTNALQRALIGELACGLSVFTAPPSALGGLGTGPGGSPALSGIAIGLYRASGLSAADEAYYVRFLGDFIDSTSQPYPASLDAADRLQQELDQRTGLHNRTKIFSQMLLPALMKSATRNAEDQAQLRMLLTALAVERHRRLHQEQPPADLTGLVPGLLPEIPLDPFDGKPLRYTVLANGYRIHSIGPDRKDNEGKSRPTGKNRTGSEEYDLMFEIAR
jgi:hypothetical protein